LSEIAIDGVVPLYSGSDPQQNAFLTMQVAFQALNEVARRQNFILHSDGTSVFTWDGSTLYFNTNSVANTIDLEFLATENVTYPAFEVQLVGSTSAPTAQTFETIAIPDGYLIYLELDSTQLVGQAGSPFALYNAINGGGTHVGLRVLMQPMSVAMPQLQIGSSGSGSLFYIPLLLRRGANLLWIPHGLIWTPNTTSELGTVSTVAYPEFFVASQTALQTAITDLAAIGGGVILITAPFSISSAITLSNGIKILGRGVGQLVGGGGSSSKNAITFLNGGSFIMQDNCELANLDMIANSAFTGTMIHINNATSSGKSQLTDCFIDFTAPSNVNTNIAVKIDGNWNRLWECTINGVSSSNKIGIVYNTGTNNADVDTNYNF
jgi:hypothetical protein